LPISFDRASNGGIVWQMTADLKPNRSGHPSVLAIGERYDSMLHGFQERHLTRTELVEFIQKMLRSDGLNGTTVDNFSQLSALGSGDNRSSGGKERERGENGLSTSASNATIKNNYSQLPNLQVTFLTHDKPTANYKRRLENQVAQQMSSTLSQFLKKETFVVLVVELPPAVVNAIVGAINPREIRKRETEPEINYVIER